MSEEMEFELAQQLNVLRSQPARDPAKAAQGRAVFLAQAQAMENSLPLSVTNKEQVRHNSWMHPLRSILKLQRKERSPMFGALGTILLIVSLVLGGSGVTVAAAQNSQPDQMLYPVKTWSEDVRVQMSSNTQSRLELALEYSQRRAAEMQAMFKVGQVPPDAVQTRMQSEIDLALRLAAGQPDGEAQKSLMQIRQRLEEQARLLDQNAPAAPQASALLARTRTMLQDRLHLCDLGLQDPAVLLDRLHERDRDRLHDGALSPTTQATNGVTGGAGGGNPWTTGTPTPGSSYGPGPGAGDGTGNGGNNPWTMTPAWLAHTSTPGSGYGPGPGAGDGMGCGGNTPCTTGTPTPGSGYGPGPGSGSGSGCGSCGGSGAGTGDHDGGDHDGSGHGGGGSGGHH